LLQQTLLRLRFNPYKATNNKKMKTSSPLVAFVAACALIAGFFPAVSSAEGEVWFTLDQFSGSPGRSIQVWGGGFLPDEPVTVSGAGAVTVQATATSWGMIDPPVSFMVPLGAPQGTFMITATGLTSGRTGSNGYYVQPLTPAISLSTGVGTPGGSVQVTGSGFGAGESVRISLGSSTLSTSTAGGSFTVSYPIPFIPPGTYQLIVQGETSGAQALDYFYVNGLYPNLSPSTYYALPGEMLSFSGTGFAPHEEIDISADGMPARLATTSADAAGNFSSASLEVQYLWTGQVLKFHAHGALSGGDASVTVTIGRLFPSVTPSAYWLMAGNILSFNGGGFGGNEAVRLFDGAGTSTLLTVGAAAGAFTNASLTVPFSMSGSTRNFRFVGERSGAEGSVSVTIGSLYPTLMPSAYYVPMGYAFTLSGTGFAPQEDISFDVGGASSTVTARANEFGNFFLAGPFRAPTQITGPVPVSAIGSMSGARATAMITVGQLYPTVSPSDYYLLPAQNLEFRGSGFVPEETVDIRIGTTTLASVQANAFGNFVRSTVAPARSGGVEYTFTGRTSGAVAVLNLTVAGTYPVVSAENYYIAPGDGTYVRGSGYVANEPVTIQMNGAFFATTTANGIGSTPLVPILMPIATGTVSVAMTGAVSGASAMTSITLIPFSPQVTPSTWWASAGTSLSFSGTGFAPRETVTLSVNGTTTASMIATAAGTFSSESFRLPNGSPSARYVFSGNLSGSSVAIDVGVGQLTPWMFLNNYYGPGGSPITISGRGFAQGEDVSFNWSGVSFATTTANASGGFDFATRVPFSTAGDKEVVGTGGWSGAVGRTGFTQAPVAASLQLGSYAVSRGTAVTFMGTGYLPDEPIEVRTDRTGDTVVHAFSADASGTFTNSGYLIPADFAEGNLTLTVKGLHSLEVRVITIWVGI
jgi:hypothetical protein